MTGASSGPRDGDPSTRDRLRRGRVEALLVEVLDLLARHPLAHRLGDDRGRRDAGRARALLEDALRDRRPRRPCTARAARVTYCENSCFSRGVNSCVSTPGQVDVPWVAWLGSPAGCRLRTRAVRRPSAGARRRAAWPRGSCAARRSATVRRGRSPTARQARAAAADGSPDGGGTAGTPSSSATRSSSDSSSLELELAAVHVDGGRALELQVLPELWSLASRVLTAGDSMSAFHFGACRA